MTPFLKNSMMVMLLSLAGQAWAATGAGLVSNISGNLSATSSEGVIRILAEKDLVMIGDTLFTARESYAKVTFTDGGEIILRPNTHFKVASYHFDEQKPESDNAGFSLLKGSLRALTGLVSKRGNKDSYKLKTPDATIGIRGTNYGLQVCRNDCDGLKTNDGKTPRNGMHSQVDVGAIVETNQAGALDVVEDEFAYAADNKVLPVKVSPDEALRIDIPQHILRDWEKNKGVRNKLECSAK